MISGDHDDSDTRLFGSRNAFFDILSGRIDKSDQPCKNKMFFEKGTVFPATGKRQYPFCIGSQTPTFLFDRFSVR